MRKAGTVLAFICGLVLAAHFLRANSFLLVLVSLGFPFLLFIKKTWAIRTVQILLVLAAGEWIHSLIAIGMERIAANQPWTRMAIILGTVALINIGSVILLGKKQANDGK